MDYTPTTEDVRDRYFECANWAAYEIQNELAIRQETDAEFHRWFAEEIRKAKTEAWYQGATDAVNYALNGNYLPENPYDNEPTP